MNSSPSSHGRAVTGGGADGGAATGGCAKRWPLVEGCVAAAEGDTTAAEGDHVWVGGSGGDAASGAAPFAN